MDIKVSNKVKLHINYDCDLIFFQTDWQDERGEDIWTRIRLTSDTGRAFIAERFPDAVLEEKHYRDDR